MIVRRLPEARMCPSARRPAPLALLRHLLDGEVYASVDESGETRFSAVPPDSNALRLAASMLELIQSEFVVWASTRVAASPGFFRYLRLGAPELLLEGELRICVDAPGARFNTRIAIVEHPTAAPVVLAGPLVVETDQGPVDSYELSIPALPLTLVEARHFVTFLVHAAACGGLDVSTFTTRLNREST